MSCSKHDGCDFGCGACSWHEAASFTKAQIVLLLAQKVAELQAIKDDRWNGFADAIEIIKKEGNDEK
jgi:hypothetical protein